MRATLQPAQSENPSLIWWIVPQQSVDPWIFTMFICVPEFLWFERRKQSELSASWTSCTKFSLMWFVSSDNYNSLFYWLQSATESILSESLFHIRSLNFNVYNNNTLLFKKIKKIAITTVGTLLSRNFSFLKSNVLLLDTLKLRDLMWNKLSDRTLSVVL